MQLKLGYWLPQLVTVCRHYILAVSFSVRFCKNPVSTYRCRHKKDRPYKAVLHGIKITNEVYAFVASSKMRSIT